MTLCFVSFDIPSIAFFLQLQVITYKNAGRRVYKVSSEYQDIVRQAVVGSEDSIVRAEL